MTKITQADREAAASYWGNDNPPQELQMQFAKYRNEVSSKISNYLRKIDCVARTTFIADEIDSGVYEL